MNNNIKSLEELLSNVDPKDVGELEQFYDEQKFLDSSSLEGTLQTNSLDCSIFLYENQLRQAILDKGDIKICPGITLFSSPIDLQSDANLQCHGIPGSCIFLGQGKTQLFNSTGGWPLDVTFDGFSFIGGYLDKVNDSYGVQGGAAYFTNPGNTTFAHSLFLYNNAETKTSPFDVYGGALSILSGQKVVIDSCFFLGNEAFANVGTQGYAYGGAVFARDSNLVIKDSKFVFNKATAEDVQQLEAYGGAVHVLFSDLVVKDSKFVFNNANATSESYSPESNPAFRSTRLSTGYSGGGALSLEDSAVSINGTYFANNRAVALGGFALGGAVIAGISKITIDKSWFSDNEAYSIEEWGEGGGIWVEESQLEVTRSKFNNNKAGIGGVSALLDADILWRGNFVLLPSIAEKTCDGIAFVDNSDTPLSCDLANVYVKKSFNN